MATFYVFIYLSQNSTTMKIALKISFTTALLCLVSCGLVGQKPDKHLTATLALVDQPATPVNVKAAMSAIQKRFESLGEKVTVMPGKEIGTIKFILETSGSAERVPSFLTTPGNLRFYEAMKQEAVVPFLEKANALKKVDTLSNNNPLFDLISSSGYMGGPVLFYIKPKDTAAVNVFFKRPDILELKNTEMKDVQFTWGVKAPDQEAFPFYALKTDKKEFSELSIDMITDAKQNYDQLGRPTIDFTLNSKGAQLWEEVTQDAYQNQFQIAIVMDGVVYSAPGVMSGPITGGRSQIAGDFTVREAQELAAILKSVSLPKLKVLEYSIQPIE